MRGKPYAQHLTERLLWTAHVRPMAVGALLANVLEPERRTIVTAKNGLRFYVDPIANLGEELIQRDEYEPETEMLFRSLLRHGDSFLDIGANEGYFTTVAASLVGDIGHVVAVEPQGRLCDIIEINAGLNGLKATVVHGAVGGVGECELHLYPSLNTGASSIVRKPKLYRKKEHAPFVDPETMLDGLEFFSLVKVDVEGFEANVVKSLIPLMTSGKIHALLIDYHASILAANQIDPTQIEASILKAGLHLDGRPEQYQGYRLYRSVR